MKAMILAAGRGERLRPLTDTTPKPLLEVAGEPLIERLIRQLVEQGFQNLVINTAWLAELLEQRLGDGRRLGARIRYSREPDGALGTAGGILQARSLLGDAPFIVVNGDVWTNFPFSTLRRQPAELAHVVLVDNPKHVPSGDFALQGEQLCNSGKDMFTFSGVAAYHPNLFDHLAADETALAPLLRATASKGLASGEHFRGDWFDVGTPQRLQDIEQWMRAKPGAAKPHPT